MAKKVIRDERLKLDIVVEGNNAQMELGKLEEESRRLKQQVKDLGSEMHRTKDKDSDAYRTMLASRKEMNQQLTVNKDKQQLIRKELGLHGLTYRQLNQEAKRLNTLLSNSTYGSEQWKKLDAELRTVRSRMVEVRGGAKQTGFSLSKMATGFNKYFSMISAFALSIGGLIAGVRKAFLAFADFDDKMADVMKTTGFTRDEVASLNEEFKKMDTRTAQEDLMEMAWIAGKLGVTGRDDILGFVNAADKIGVALSKDLGGNVEAAVREIGKLTDVFKLTDELGIEQAMLKTASAINELGMASTASEGFLVDFASRAAGIAPAAGISITNVLGLGATLDQLGQQAETSGTVYSQAMTGMFKKTEEFAKVAGMEIGEFSRLIEEDANEAFIRVLDGIRGNEGGMKQLVSALEELGLEGRRATGILGVLANNTEVLRKEQELAAEAFLDGTSVLDEFNIKNTTARAELDKAVKSIQNTWKELGEKLAPVLQRLITKGTLMVRSLTKVVDLFIAWRLVLVPLLSVFVTYAAAVAGHVVVMKTVMFFKKGWIALKVLLTAGTWQAVKAQIALNTAMKANVFGAVAAAIVGIVMTIRSLVKAKNDVVNATKEAARTTAQFATEVNNERRELDSLFTSLKNTEEGTDARKVAVERINSTYGQYLPKLLSEKSTLQEIEAAQRSATQALVENIATKMKSAKQDELVTKRLEKEVEYFAKITKKMSVDQQAIFSRDWEKAIDDSVQFGTMRNEAIRLSDKYNISQSRAEKALINITSLRRQENYELKQIDASMSSYLKSLQEGVKVQGAGANKLEATKENLAKVTKEAEELEKQIAAVNAELEKQPERKALPQDMSLEEIRRHRAEHETSESAHFVKLLEAQRKALNEKLQNAREMQAQINQALADKKPVKTGADDFSPTKEPDEKEGNKLLKELERQAEAIKKAYESLYDEVEFIEMDDYNRSIALLERKFEEQQKIIEKARTTMVKGADGKMAPVISEEEATRSLELIEIQYLEKRMEIDQKEYENLVTTSSRKIQHEEEYQQQVERVREIYREKQTELTRYELALLEEQFTQRLFSEQEYVQRKAAIQEQTIESHITLEEELHSMLASIRRKHSDEGFTELRSQLTELNTVYVEKKNEVLMSDEEYHRRHQEITTNSQNLTRTQVTQHLEELNQERETRNQKALVLETEYHEERQRIINQAAQDDVTLQQELQRQEKIIEIRKRYGLESNAEILQEELRQLKAIHAEGLMAEADYQKARAEIIKQHTQATGPDEKILTGSNALANLQVWFDQEKSALATQYDGKIEMADAYQQALTQLELVHEEARKQIRDEAIEGTLSTMADMFGVIAGFFEQGSAEYKLFASFQVTLDSIQAAMSAYASTLKIPIVGPVLAPIAAATAAAFGIAQIAKINATEVPSFSAPQYYTGHYDVLGEQTGKRYQAKYKGKPKTGYVTTPSLYLAGDDPNRLKEMIISGPDLENPMIADYARAILDIKANRQPMFAMPQDTSYSRGASSGHQTSPGESSGGVNAGNGDMIALLQSINNKLDNPTRAFMVYSEFEQTKQKMENIQRDVRSS